MAKSIKAPWYKFYDNEKEHLEYPDFSAYKLIEYEFLKQIDEAARGLKALGVKYKDVVSICMPNTPEGIISFYAVNKIGAIASMIHPLSAENEIKNYLNISRSEWLITIDFTEKKVDKIINDTKVKKVVLVGVGESMPPITKSLYATTTIPKIIKTMILILPP